MIMLELLLAVASGLVAGAVVALKYIAPKTASKKDDELLALLEKVLPYLPKPTAAEVVARLEARK